MLKRGAAIAAMGLALFQAIGIVGALPASALAPVVTTEDDCAVSAGTLFIYGDTGGVDTAADVVLQMNGTSLVCITGANSSETFLSTDYDRVVVASEGSVTFKLQDLSDLIAPYAAGDFLGKDYAIAATGSIAFDGTGVTDPRDDANIAASTTAFQIGTTVGRVTWLASYSFTGTIAGDTFDASGSTVPVVANGGDGNDMLDGGTVNDTLTGGAGDDELNGNGGNDTASDGIGDDILHGGAGNDYLTCNGGVVTTEADQCWGDEGDDLIYANTPATGKDVVAPGDGDDDITGAGVITYADSSAAVTVDLDDGETLSTAGDDLFTGVGGVVGSSKADTLYGTADDDVIKGGGGADLIYGLAGNDKLAGGSEADTIRGAGGADRITGGGGDDKLYGNKGADTLYGQKGLDKAWGGDGPDLCVAEKQDSCEYDAK